MKFTAQESQDILGSERQPGKFQQFGKQAGQCRTVAKQEVGRILGLVGDPVIALLLQHIAPQRIYLVGVCIQDGWPGESGKLVGERLSPLRMLQLDQS